MNTYLKRVSLQGFRTIRHVDTTFKPGLNLIIGQNGSGKTNFVSFLKKVLDFDFKSLGVFDAELEFSGSRDFNLIIARNIEAIRKQSSNPILSLQMSEPTIQMKEGEHVEMLKSGDEFHEMFPMLIDNIQLIEHGISQKGFNHFIQTPFSFSVYKQNAASDDLHIALNEEGQSLFVRSILANLLVTLYSFESKNMEETDLGTRVKIVFSAILKNINQDIANYLPIAEVRLSSTYKFYLDIVNDQISVEGLFLEFFVNGSWLPFSSLSDGTKRLFYIYAELTASNHHFLDGEISPAEDKIILLEEPELGVHPHQFHLLMNLLKKIAENNQLIVTTHAPQALNILESDELDAISIAYFDRKKGTMIEKLDEVQMDNARLYMQEMYLSDYWTYSNLEKR